jgi:PncC family amidohydrolase
MKRKDPNKRDLPERRVAAALKKKKMKLALAESCTGGAVSDRITDMPGSSDYFKGTVIAYSNDIKTSVLGVPAGMIKKHGAVSRQVALAMAKGARLILGGNIAAAITGIAGPSGARPGKPVGLAFVALVSGKRSVVRKALYKGGRKQLKAKFAEAVLELIAENI